ncbi:Nramp family divalent metal transporter [Sphingomonas carotinifaciens]|uniref:Divalent metal cation transporter MntH n=1 Tax=Sphingomonas carotinifaciens TaxID=1166323 RepID=A0A1G7FZ45_9SPHN|nr:Nramp family divalent metal transporter [Sphingomonas carotinifaciens]MBB4086305.1 manganese transport protein [Sphingomonas carotinifaciens]MWC42625.1 Mn(2+) uptake NRAMP transporter MntH [Sphingomonas carotinifaciens]SDE81183.1 manganese transport protein [Sphingomonas carotinifaciens]
MTAAAPVRRSLAESHRSVAIPEGASFWRRLFAFAGPGYLVAVGYMDPGNWATGIAGGSAYGYALLSVILLSNLMAMVLQALSARLGIAAGLDLAQACRAQYSSATSRVLWLLCEIAIIACDLAEVLGTAIALKLLFGLPLTWGVLITALDVFVILALQRFGFRKLEAFIVTLLLVIAGCFLFELFASHPDPAAVAAGLVPTSRIVTDPAMLYLAIGILGATVMPHNLYLHSSVVQTRAFGEDDKGKREAVRLATIDSTVALGFAFFINAAILIVSAATFHIAGRTDIAEIDEAYRLLAPMLGVGAASIVFAVALLASGQNSTVTGTLAGQIVMEGFLDLRIPGWARRLITRALAIIPAVLVVGAMGDAGATRLLVLSQVILSLQLPFAVVPLVKFTGDRALMGRFASPVWLRILAWTIASVIIVLNIMLLWGAVFG